MPLVEDAGESAVPDTAADMITSSSLDEKAGPYPPGKGSSSPMAIPAPSPSLATPSSPYHARRVSEESIRTELCEGPLLDGSPVPPAGQAAPSKDTPPPRAPQQQEQEQEQPSPLNWTSSVAVTDRAELIERLKRGESPTWVPNRRLESMIRMRSRSPTPPGPRPASATASRSSSSGASLLPAANIAPERPPSAHNLDADDAATRLRDGLHLERPRSALHRGDFTASGRTEEDTAATATTAGAATGRTSATASLATEAPAAAATPRGGMDTGAAWFATSPPRDFLPFGPASADRRSLPSRSSLAELGIFASSPLSSSSLSTSFVYKPPTSPLVQSQSQTDDEDENDDDDDDDDAITFPMGGLDGSPTTTAMPQRRRTNQRRHTLAFAAHTHPHSFGGGGGSLSFSSHPSRPPLTTTGRRDGLFPYQAHQPRRSLSSTSSHNPFRGFPAAGAAMTAPQTPAAWSRSRRVSVSSDTSPLQQHASMVGSYEESILRGRMSTTPSKPLDFLAQIGVLGLGPGCKPSLRCPPHVTIPFAAVFYSYQHATMTTMTTTTTTAAAAAATADDSPSPYVGTIDLENGLPNPDAELRGRRRAALSSRRAASRARTARPTTDGGDGDVVMEDAGGDGEADADADADAHADAHAAGMAAPAAPRTQHRRRTANSSSPKAPPGGSYRIPEKGQLQIIIKNQNKTAVKLFLVPYDLAGMEPGTKTFIRQRSYSAGPAVPTTGAAPADRPVLRYLVHLHICCPARGRHYLYRSIRVVFANRVPDDKETLRIEATFPEPRFSPYKPVRASPLPASSGGAGFAVDPAALRRRSAAGLSFAAPASFPARGDDDGGTGTRVTGTSPFDAFGIRHGTPPAPLSFSPLPAPMLPAGPASYNTGGGGRSAPVDPIPRHRAPAASSPPLSSPLSSAASQQTSRPSSGHAGAGRLGAGEGTAAGAGAGVDDTADGSPRQRARGADHDAGVPHAYRKLRRGDAGYGGAAAAEGLLSQRLRSLDVRTAPGDGQGGAPDE